MDNTQQTTRDAVCQVLRDRVLIRVYGSKSSTLAGVPGMFVSDLYPFDTAFLMQLVERTIARVIAVGFNIEHVSRQRLRYARFNQLHVSMFDTWYDSLDMRATGLLAYRFDAYDNVTTWAKDLGQRYPTALSPEIAHRLAKVVTILSIPEMLDEAYFTGPNAQHGAYSDDPAVIFTALIDWFVQFLDTYERFGVGRGSRQR